MTVSSVVAFAAHNQVGVERLSLFEAKSTFGTDMRHLVGVNTANVCD